MISKAIGMHPRENENKNKNPKLQMPRKHYAHMNFIKMESEDPLEGSSAVAVEDETEC